MLSLILATSIAVSPATAQATTIDPTAAPELVWTDLAGHRQSLTDYRGRIVVLNFWATWCAPCRDELPDLVRIQDRFGMYGVQVVGAAADSPDHATTVAEFGREFEIDFPILLGATTDQMQALGAGVALPATVVVDRAGNVIESIAGVFDPERLEARIASLLDVGAAHDESSFELHASTDDHDHGHDQGDEEHHHPPQRGTGASLVPS